MKAILILCSLLFSTIAPAQILSVKAIEGTGDIDVLKKAFAEKDIKCVVISSSFIINDTLKIPEGKTIKFEPGCSISGKGVINGGIIDAGYQQIIFDTSLTVNPGAVNQYFSVKWFGAKGEKMDNYPAIQKSINTCIKNNIRTLYIPAGYYKISKPLILRGIGSDKNREFCTLEILGESSFWDSNVGTEIIPTFDDAFAIGIQRGKGCKIRKLRITGVFSPPNTGSLAKFLNTPFENFTDGKCRDKRYSPYAAIVIDPFTNIPDKKADTSAFYPGLLQYYGTNGKSAESGSTAIQIEEISINKFVVGICSSPNGLTRNAEITLINKIQFSNCKLCISGGQDQEKANDITNIYCWGGTHTMFATGLYGGTRMAGNWNIDHVNIAGVVRFIFNEQHGYFASYISHVYAEVLGTWGTINSELACEISDCNVDFAYENIAGKRTLLTSWGKNVVYRSCNFRFYGEKTALTMEGDCVFEHCYFSGAVEKKNGILENFYLPGDGVDKRRLWLYIVLFLLTAIVAILFFYRRNHTSKAIKNPKKISSRRSSREKDQDLFPVTL